MHSLGLGIRQAVNQAIHIVLASRAVKALLLHLRKEAGEILPEEGLPAVGLAQHSILRGKGLQ